MELGLSLNRSCRLLQVGYRLISSAVDTIRNTRAGLPATIVFGGTSLVTTLPAPIRAFSPMVTPQSTVAPEPIEAPFFTTVAATFQSDSVCSSPTEFVARG